MFAVLIDAMWYKCSPSLVFSATFLFTISFGRSKEIVLMHHYLVF